MFKNVTQWMRRLRSKWTEISFEKKVSMFVAPIFVAVITAVLVPRIAGSGTGAGHETLTRDLPGENLEVSDLSIRNSPEGTSIDISVRNTGRIVAVATRARFRILSFAILGACLPEAYLLPTQTYELVLPIDHALGKTRDVVISQEIEANDADRFSFSVGVDDEMLTSTVSYLYRLKIALFHDRRPTPVEAGSIWLAEPFPQEHWFSLREDLDEDYGSEVEACVDENKRDLSAIYHEQATLSPDLADFAERVGLKR